MPQMAPIWWFSLFMSFIITYCIFMMMMYTTANYSIKTKKTQSDKMTKNINWKW